MEKLFNTSVEAELLAGMRIAKASLTRHELVVLPTDTVYGLGCDAFSPKAVAALLAAKGRGRQSPPPVLIPNITTMDALADNPPQIAKRLADAFWPGALTMILQAQPSLQWDLGETRGTVALRMPDHTIALALLEEVGPMAVSSANLTGEPAATTCQQAADYLGKKVAVYLDAGPSPKGEASTILDLTSIVETIGEDGETKVTGQIRIVRQGAIAAAEIKAVVGDLLADENSNAAEGNSEAAG